jgi:glucans biosynthesis protein
LDENPIGFGLLQRDRNFDHYQDLERRFDQQPGYWVTPKGKWGKGHIELVEIPSPSETNDNIVAYWVPETQPSAGSEMQVAYSVTATRDGTGLHRMAQTTDTRIQRLSPRGDEDRSDTRFVLNFAGGELDYFSKDAKNLRADISASDGEIRNIRILPDPENGGVRVFFDLVKTTDAMSSNLRAFLLYRDKVLSETWTMPWAF